MFIECKRNKNKVKLLNYKKYSSLYFLNLGTRKALWGLRRGEKVQG